MVSDIVTTRLGKAHVSYRLVTFNSDTFRCGIQPFKGLLSVTLVALRRYLDELTGVIHFKSDCPPAQGTQLAQICLHRPQQLRLFQVTITPLMAITGLQAITRMAAFTVRVIQPYMPRQDLQMGTTIILIPA